MTDKIFQIVSENSKTLSEHSKILSEQSKTLSEHSKILSEQSKTLSEHSKRFDEHDKRFDEHDKRFDKIETLLLQHDERLDNIEERLDKTVTTEQFTTAYEEMITILKRLDDERVFTVEWVKRLELRVDAHEKELTDQKDDLQKVKLRLKIA